MQRVRGVKFLVVFLTLCSFVVLVFFSARLVMVAPFLPFHLCVSSHAAICSGCIFVALYAAALGAAWRGGRDAFFYMCL